MLAPDALTDPVLVAAMRDLCARHGCDFEGMRKTACDILEKLDMPRDDLIRTLASLASDSRPPAFVFVDCAPSH